MQRRYRQVYMDVAWCVSFFVVMCLLLNKCRYGFAHIDESFYLTVPLRLAKGDSLLVHEWHVSQLSSVILLPIVELYLYFTHSTDGTLLAFRYIFTIAHGMTAIWLFWKLRKQNIAAFVVSLAYLIFAPFGIMALSYHSLGVALMVIVGVRLYAISCPRWCQSVLTGIVFAGAVLCCPHLILLYLTYGIACLAVQCYMQRRSISDEFQNVWSLKRLFWFTLGCAIAATAFFIFVFSKCTISEIAQSIEHILGDPEHKIKTFKEACAYYLVYLLGSNRTASAVLSGIILLTIVILADKKVGQRQVLYFLIACGLTIAYLIPFLNERVFLNFLMLPLSILGFFCFLLSPKGMWKEMLYMWIPGMIYGFCLNWGSNQGFHAITNGTTLATLGSIIMMVRFYRQTLQCGIGKSLCTGTIYGLLILFLASELSIRYDSLFWEKGNMDQMTATCVVGSEKGIIASPELAGFHEKLYQDTQVVRDSDAGNVLYYTRYTWLYLEDKKPSATFSAWISEVNDVSAMRLISYYQLNLDKQPDVAYILKEDKENAQILIEYFEDMGFVRKETELGYVYERQ